MDGLEDDFELESAPAAADRLTLDLDGWEGPLDLLLTLARTQKVDLARISILALVEQYLSYIENARSLRLEIAADLPKGASDQVIRTVTENSRTLKFDTHGFERE